MCGAKWLAVGLLIIGGLSLAVSCSHQRRLANVPRVTCDELRRNGPAADGLATLTDIKVCGNGHLMHRDGLCPGDVELYVPVFAGHLQREPPPSELNLLLAIHDDDPLDRLLQSDGPFEFTCQVDRHGNRLDDWVRQGLTAKYPGIRLATCWILNVGLHEPSPFVARRMLQLGLFSLLLGGIVLTWLALWFGTRITYFGCVRRVTTQNMDATDHDDNRSAI